MMKNDDLMSELFKRLTEKAGEQIPLSEIMQFFDSWGVTKDEESETRCQALAEYVRHLLKDKDIDGLMRATQEARHLFAVQQTILSDPKLAQRLLLAGQGVLEDRLKALDIQIKNLRARSATKIEVIGRIAEVLKKLRCEDKIDLPIISPEFPDLF